MHEDKRSIDYSRHDGGDVSNVAGCHVAVHTMSVGALVRSIHDHQLRGLVMELGPHHRYCDDHSNRVVKVLENGQEQWYPVGYIEVINERG